MQCVLTSTAQVYTRHNQLQRQEVGDTFEMPPAGMFRLHLRAEIVSAAGFEHSCLYVNWVLDLPPGWAAAQDTPLQVKIFNVLKISVAAPKISVEQGVSQRCWTSGEGDVAHFCLPVEADLFFCINQLDEDREVVPRWPQLLLEVASCDG